MTRRGSHPLRTRARPLQPTPHAPLERFISARLGCLDKYGACGPAVEERVLTGQGAPAMSSDQSTRYGSRSLHARARLLQPNPHLPSKRLVRTRVGFLDKHGACGRAVSVGGGNVIGTETRRWGSLGRWQRLVLRAVALDTYHEKRSRASRRRTGATDSHTTERSVILPSEQAIVEGGGFDVLVGR